MEVARHRPIALAILIALIVHLIFLYYYFTFEIQKQNKALWTIDDHPSFIMLDSLHPQKPKDNAQETEQDQKQPTAQSPIQSSPLNTLQPPQAGFNNSPWDVHTDDEIVTLDGAIVDGNSFKVPDQTSPVSPAAAGTVSTGTVPTATASMTTADQGDTDDEESDGENDENALQAEVQPNDTPIQERTTSNTIEPVLVKELLEKTILVKQEKVPVASESATKSAPRVKRATTKKQQQSKQLAHLAHAFSQNFDQHKHHNNDAHVQRARVMAQRVGEFKAVSYFQKVYQSLYESFMRSDPVTVDVAIQKVIKMVIVINKQGKPIDVQLPMRTGSFAIDNHIITTIQKTRFPRIPDHLNQETITLPCEAFVNLPPGTAVINFHYR